MPGRLGMGELERHVLDVLWAAGQPLSPRDVHTELRRDPPLAYTTIMTILVRLWQKGVLHRERHGRAFTYVPLITRDEYTARRMRDALAASSDPVAALAHFVDGLDTDERSRLRRLLGKKRS